jgi:phenylacetate-CoA ligase
MIQPIELFEAYKLFKNQWKDAEYIKRIQEKKLRKLIKHSYEKVPYYRSLFDSINLKPEHVQSIEDLKKIPLLSKKIIKSLPVKELIAKGINIAKSRTATTSGSTSIPLKVYYNWQDARMIGIALVRNLMSCGVKPWYKIAEFSGFAELPYKRRFFDRFGIWRCWNISAWEEPKNWIDILQRWKPQVIYGYVLTLKLLARTLMEKNIKDINPQIVISTSGVLDEASRKLMRSAFRAKVFDFYGSWEGGTIAWECPTCSGYHINSDMVIVEVLDKGKPISPGQEGEAVITNLHSSAMPFIRYRQEDVVILSEEKPICGRPFPLMKHIKGRLADFITLSSGKRISPHPFFHLLDYAPEVAQWTLVQETFDKLSIKIVPTENFDKSFISKIEMKLRKLVGENVEINISLVNKIKAGPSHKIRVVSSKVSNSD